MCNEHDEEYACLYKTSGRYQSVANQSFTSGGQGVAAQILARGGVGAVGNFGMTAVGFKCDSGSCRCDGTDDCVDLFFNSGLCRGNFNCYTGWVTGELVCTCSRR